MSGSVYNNNNIVSEMLGTSSVSSASSTSSSSPSSQWMDSFPHPCNIVRMDPQEFSKRFGPNGLPPLYPHPLVITSDIDKNDYNKSNIKNNNYKNNKNNNYNRKMKRQYFQNLTSQENILQFFPSNFTVTLSSSNSFSEHRRTIPFSQYLEETCGVLSKTNGETLPDQKANETWYLFGETYSQEWKDLLRHYVLPQCEACIPNDETFVALSFGIGNKGSGVQWHVHGPGFSEAIHGKKHWVLSQDKPKGFHPDQTSLNWMEYIYPELSIDDRPYECTLDPGDVIYFPDMWWHATINLDKYTAFVSTFTLEHLFAATQEQLNEGMSSMLGI